LATCTSRLFLTSSHCHTLTRLDNLRQAAYAWLKRRLAARSQSMKSPARIRGIGFWAASVSLLVCVSSRPSWPSTPFPKSVDTSKVFGWGNDPLPMLADAASPPRLGEIYYFFHVPKAAGTSLVAILRLHNMITAATSRIDDLANLESTQALQRKTINYLKTPLFHDTCAMLQRSQLRGRAFTILREPTSRIISLYWYKKDSSTWEKHYDPAYASRSVEEFLNVTAKNWLVNTLAKAVVPTGPSGELLAAPSAVDAAARWVLLEKTTFGFVDDLEASLDMIFEALGIKLKPRAHAGVRANATNRTKAGLGDVSAFLPVIAAANARDLSLYYAAREAFDRKKAARAAHHDMNVYG